MKPRIELDQPPQAFSQVVSPQQAAQLHDNVHGYRRTGRYRNRDFCKAAETAPDGGKTGTAEKQALLYDEKTGKLEN